LRTMHTDGSGGKFFNLAWSPDGRWLAGGATDYKLWTSVGDEVIHVPSGAPSWGLAWSPNSTSWATGDESGNIEVRGTGGQVVARMRNEGNVDTLAWSPDGTTVAGGDGVTFWHADGSLLRNHIDLRARTNSVAWSPDGKKLASADSDGVVRLWSADGTLLASLTGHTGSVNRVAWAPDDKTLASCAERPGATL
jgi:WD40 repeat protein